MQPNINDGRMKIFSDFFFFLMYRPYILSQAAARGCAPTKQGRKPEKRIPGTRDTGNPTQEKCKDCPQDDGTDCVAGLEPKASQARLEHEKRGDI